MTAAPEISVVVEWENVLLARRARCEAMLERLGRQARALGRPVEILVLHDPAAADAADVRLALSAHLGAEGSGPAPWRRIEAPGRHYYEMKNLGAREARGSIVVFVDSDVVPEADWLREILRPFEDPAAAVVGGATFVDPTGLVGRALALGWFFPPPPETVEVHDRATHFWANNVAFRRRTLIENPFPEPGDGATRGACADLARSLRAQGVRIWRTNAARVRHPPPNGLRHFVVRAVADGRDRVLAWRRAGKRRWRLPWRALSHYARKTAHAVGATARLRRQVGLSLPLVPAAWAVEGAYYGLAYVGVVATCAFPGPMSRAFRI